MLRHVSIIFLFFLGSASCGRIHKDKIHLEPTLENLLNSLHKLMIFFSQRYDKLNVDGLFGIRAVQGEMVRALSLADTGIYKKVRDNPEIRRKLEQILQITQETAELALPEVKKKDEKYYMNFLSIIGKPWRMFELQPQKIGKVKENELPSTDAKTDNEGQRKFFDEQKSDLCMGTLLGNDHEKCDVNTCWDLMTEPGTTLYYTTHQILWFQLGMSAGCQQEFEAKVPEIGGIEKIFQRLCGNVIFQMDTLFQHGTVLYPYQDIFLEKGMVCGGIGFMDAVNLTWLEEVMSWQHDKLGCFREIDTNGLQFNEEDYNKWIVAKKEEWRSRNLLDDMEMGDRCSAHKSAVAAGFYAIYTRLFLDPDYMKYQLWPALYGDQYEKDADETKRRLMYFTLGLLIACFMLISMGPRRRYQILRWLSCWRK